MIHQDYSSMLEDRKCQGGCGLKFRVLPSSTQFYARTNCATHCKGVGIQAAPVDMERLPHKSPPMKPLALPSEPVLKRAPNLKQPSKPKPEPKVEVPIEVKLSEPIIKKEEQVVQTEVIADFSISPRKKEEKREDLIELQVKPQKAKKTSVDVDVVERLDSKLQQFWTACISDAKKLLTKDDLRSKMGVAYLAMTDASMRGQNPIKSYTNFSLSIGLDLLQLESWVAVRQLIWEKIDDVSMIEKYRFEDLVLATKSINAEMSNQEVQALVEKQILGKYATLIQHYKASMHEVDHFFARYSLDLIPEADFDVLNESLKNIVKNFKAHAERLRDRNRKRNKKG